METVITNQRNKNIKQSWLKKIGIAGFMFFLVKGLVWLAVIFGAKNWIF